MTCILIDDERDCLDLLAILIHKHCPDLEIIGQFQSPKQGIEAIWDHRPDLVFLDVDMPEVNGFGVLDACREVPFQTIFTTAFQEYAVRAFKYSATDYLLKPIERQDLMESVKKAREARSAQQHAEQREILLNFMNPKGPSREKIALPTSEGIVFLPVADIDYCQADGNYTRVFTADMPNGALFVKSLREIEEMLQGQYFCRSHNSYLVNLKKVKGYIRGDGGELRMSNGKTVPVARPRKQEILERLSRI